MIGFFLVFLMIGRSIGWPLLPFLLLIAHLFAKPYSEKWFPWLVVLGVVTDSVLGRPFGITSLLLLLTYLELSVYKEMVDNASGWSVFLTSVLMSAQTSIFWGVSMPLWLYFLNGCVGLAFWLLQSMTRNRGFDGGVYLRKSS